MRTKYIQGPDGKLRHYREHVKEFGKPQKRKQKPANIINRFFDAYESPTSGEVITSRAQRADDMKRSDCIEYDPCLRQDIDERIKREEAALDKSVDETVDRYFSGLSVDEAAKLENEIKGGADTEVVRMTAGENNE